MTRGKQIRIGKQVRTIPSANATRFGEIEHTLRQLYPAPEHANEYQAAITAAATYLIDAPEPPSPWTIRSASRGNDNSATIVDRWKTQLDAIIAPYAQQLHQARAELDAATAAARTLATLATDDGLTEPATAERFDVDRLTLRKWRGKKDR
ncbi:hypothetical protein [Mycolicibacterium goodii]|uniref:hypothetical protein n=1 Tax=Mycolicibacterium goodii TaxID=134601 RepID=UPI001BDC52FC|nr:hypothetical protein [Mycolicibacterium goodii]MBU8841179.1 hypothetical protein [Mycolicibacterium goodii]